MKLYEVTYNSTSGFGADLYDIVLIAAPLHPKTAKIAFRNFDPPIAEFPNSYHQTVATFVHGNLNSSFFGYPDPSSFYLGEILTTEDPKLFFNSISLISPVKGKAAALNALAGPAVWKVFSRQPLTKEEMHLLFSSYDTVEVKKWLAYPEYSPAKKIPPIILHDGLYYLNGIEQMASAMEMSTIGAKNAALLAYHRWYDKPDVIDQEDLHERLKTEL